MNTSRGQAIDALTHGTLDVLVIGGGIVGAGIARDAAMRGLRVGLVDMHDFAYGTSSRSSRLLHGGLRYLAQGRIGLVREASLEKRVIHHIAPHLVQPLPFVFPTHHGDREWVLWQLKIGVKLYDALCGFKNLGVSESLTPAQVLERLPLLDATRLNGGVRYYDGLTNDARLVFDTLRSAARHEAALVNRAKLANVEHANNTWHCTIDDRVGGRILTVRARWIVNASGPWADRFQQSKLKLRLTKGVHLVIDAQRLRVPEAVVLTEGRRILFVIPWGERTIIGTTDTDHQGEPAAVLCDENDVEYLLKIVNQNFPAANLSRIDVLSAWAGLRPLIADKHGHPSDASRSHQIIVGDHQWIDVASGKLTTYRLIAEQTVDQIVRREKRSFHPCRTADEPLVQPDEVRGVSSIIPTPPTREAVVHYCRNEWAMTLEDVMVRRSSWHYYLHDPLTAAQEVARWMADELNWDAARIERESADYRTAVYHRADADPTEGTR